MGIALLWLLLRSKTWLKLPRVVRRTLLSAGILLMAILIGGSVYTWMTDRQAPQLAATPTADVISQSSPIKPIAPAADAKEGAAVEMLNSPVAPGGNVSMSIHTNPTSTCTIAIAYGQLVVSDPNLAPQTADEYGSANWSWVVPAKAPAGTWPVKVTCVYHGRTGFVQGDLRVIKQ